LVDTGRADDGIPLGDAAMTRGVLGLLTASVIVAHSEPKVPERDLLRGYAFAYCLAEGYRGTPFERDAEHVAGLYMEIGRTIRPEIYERLQQAAKNSHPEKRAVVENANVAIMICLELYDSKEVRALAAGRVGATR
jgi:hypothetical protein